MYARARYVRHSFGDYLGDEAIIPDFTFVSTVNAFVLRGAKPVFIDVRADTLDLDELKLEGFYHAVHESHCPRSLCGCGL